MWSSASLLTCDIHVLPLNARGDVDPPPLLCVVVATEAGNTALTALVNVHFTPAQTHTQGANRSRSALVSALHSPTNKHTHTHTHTHTNTHTQTHTHTPTHTHTHT